MPRVYDQLNSGKRSLNVEFFKKCNVLAAKVTFSHKHHDTEVLLWGHCVHNWSTLKQINSYLMDYHKIWKKC